MFGLSAKHLRDKSIKYQRYVQFSSVKGKQHKFFLKVGGYNLKI